MTFHASIVALLAGCLIGGCRGQSAQGVTVSSAPTVAAEAVSPHGASIYALTMTLTDQTGERIGLDAFRGKPVLIGMFYATCPSACPLLISTIKRVLSGLDAGAQNDVRVLLVSFDPERDTPQALHGIFSERGLDARWRLANAPDDQVRELAALLGVRYRRLPDGNFSHTSSIVLLDRAGTIDTRLDDMTLPLEPLIARAESL